jgi:hypothetical protein
MTHMSILQLQWYLSVRRFLLSVSFADIYLSMNWYNNQFVTRLHKHVSWYVLARMFGKKKKFWWRPGQWTVKYILWKGKINTTILELNPSHFPFWGLLLCTCLFEDWEFLYWNDSFQGMWEAHVLQFFSSSVVLCASNICHFICSVFTPYYSETVLYSIAELQKRNEDGISTLFYLQKIYPGLFFLSIVKFTTPPSQIKWLGFV